MPQRGYALPDLGLKSKIKFWMQRSVTSSIPVWLLPPLWCAWPLDVDRNRGILMNFDGAGVQRLCDAGQSVLTDFHFVGDEVLRGQLG